MAACKVKVIVQFVILPILIQSIKILTDFFVTLCKNYKYLNKHLN